MTTNNHRFGILAAKYIELPYQNTAEKLQVETINVEIAGTRFRACVGAYDFGFIDLTNLESDSRKKTELLKSGWQISLFKTIQQGEIFWTGKINFDYSHYHHGYQCDLSQTKWARMFNSNMPARLEKRAGAIVFGALTPFYETGTEGVIWLLSKYGVNGYGALESIEDGDILTVYSKVIEGEVDFTATLRFSKRFKKSKPVNGEEFATKVLRYSYHIKPDAWLQLTWQNRPCYIFEPR